MAETRSLAEALCAAQKQMQNPKKDKTARVRTKSGGEYTYSYTTLDAVLDVVRPALNEQGVFLSQHSESAAGGMMLHTRVMYGDAVQELDVTPYQYDKDPQEFGKRETYARRYSLLKAFGLAGDDDTDGDTGAGGSEPPARVRDAAVPAVGGGEAAVASAKQALWAACKGYAERHGLDPRSVSDGCLKRPDFDSSEAWYLSVAAELDAS